MGESPELGDVLDDRYELRERLGSGGFATVWRAYDLDRDANVAVKIADTTSHEQREVRQRFEASFDALTAVTEAGGHPNIVTAFDVRTDDIPYIVTELVEGPTLDAAVESGRLPPGPTTVFDVGLEICDALAFLHETGVLYLDLKPSNVVLDSDDPIIVDFNTAVTDQRDGTIFHDDEYKPVEQTPSEGRSLPTHEPADVYACGRLLTYLLTGEPELDGSLPLDTELSSGLVATLRRATARRPSARQSDCRELTVGLQSVQSGARPTANVTSLETGETRSVSPGETFGRDTDKADFAVHDPEQFVAPVQARFEWVGTGWEIVDTSINGTYVKRNGSWHFALSEEGYQKQRESGLDPGTDERRPAVRATLSDGSLIRPVAPEFDTTLRFRTE